MFEYISVILFTIDYGRVSLIDFGWANDNAICLLFSVKSTLSDNILKFTIDHDFNKFNVCEKCGVF